MELSQTSNVCYSTVPPWCMRGTITSADTQLFNLLHRKFGSTDEFFLRPNRCWYNFAGPNPYATKDFLLYLKDYETGAVTEVKIEPDEELYQALDQIYKETGQSAKHQGEQTEWIADDFFTPDAYISELIF